MRLKLFCMILSNDIVTLHGLIKWKALLTFQSLRSLTFKIKITCVAYDRLWIACRIQTQKICYIGLNIHSSWQIKLRRACGLLLLIINYTYSRSTKAFKMADQIAAIKTRLMYIELAYLFHGYWRKFVFDKSVFAMYNQPYGKYRNFSRWRRWMPVTWPLRSI